MSPLSAFITLALPLILQVFDENMRLHIIRVVFLSTSQQESCDVTVAFTFCLFKYSPRCSVRLTSGDCEGKAMHVSTLISSLDFKQTWHSITACLGPLSCWKMNLFPRNFKSEGMACLWRIEWYFSLVSVKFILCESPVPEKAKHPHTWIFPPPYLTVGFMPCCINLSYGARSGCPCFGWKRLDLHKVSI